MCTSVYNCIQKNSWALLLLTVNRLPFVVAARFVVILVEIGKILKLVIKMQKFFFHVFASLNSVGELPQLNRILYALIRSNSSGSEADLQFSFFMLKNNIKIPGLWIDGNLENQT